jgi:hypothetical protein
MKTKEAFDAFEASQFIGEELGYGRIDLPAAVTELESLGGHKRRSRR